jgi:hypothetical protein
MSKNPTKRTGSYANLIEITKKICISMIMMRDKPTWLERCCQPFIG